MDLTEQRGIVLAAMAKICPYGDRWKVPSQSGHGFYMDSLGKDTGRQHAGENLADVLQRRAAELAPPMQMCDALSRKLPKLPEKLEVIVGIV